MRPVALAHSSARELHALRLAARQGRCLLADVDIAEPDARKVTSLSRTAARHGRTARSSTGHVQHVGDGLVLEPDLQCLAVVALAVAFIAGDINVGQEVHLDLDEPIALAGFAAAAFHVEENRPGS